MSIGKFNYLKLVQPAGTMYLGVLRAKDIDELSKINRLSENFKGGWSKDNIQREENKNRIKNIATFADSPNAIFPTPIILTGKSDYVEVEESENKSQGVMFFKEDAANNFSIIDGQHRLLGIKNSKAFNDIELPVVIFLDTEPYEDAMIFITINGNQVKVPQSIIYQLFDIMPNRSVEKTLHNLANNFNTDIDSPYYNRIKMLGIKLQNQDFAPISQSSFITPLKKMFSSHTGKFYDFFKDEKDDVIYKILFNYFSAVSKVFYNDWNDEKSMLPRAIGFKALIELLDRELFNEGLANNDLSMNFFEQKFRKISEGMNENEEGFSSEEIGSSYGGASRLYQIFTKYI
ncbi:TPA: DGQHR domain-containing protein [Streptococcus suis]|nr:DGQHR domain-containing protein [Streptococcus suis]